MKLLKEEKGITLIALVITVILLLIIGGISIMGGTSLVNTAKAETIETNMLTIKAKAKEYMENVDSINWALDDKEVKDEYDGLTKKEWKNRKELQDTYQLTLIEEASGNVWYKDGYTYYKLEKKALDKMDLPDLYEEGEVYIVRYPLEDGNIENLKMDIIYSNGIEYKGTVYYELSKLEQEL